MANQEQLDNLKQGVKDWNKWREENPDDKIDLIEVDFRGVHLSGAVLSKALLRRANFSKANLEGANFSQANLSKANLRGANLRNANLKGAYLNNTNLREANLSNANMRGTKLHGAILNKANLIRANLKGAALSQAHLFIANLNGADLRNANLREVDLREADLRNADLSGADLGGANLTDANLSNANFSGTNLVSAMLIQTNVDEATISGSNVYGSSIWDLRGRFKEQKDLIITPKNDATITVDNIKVAQFVYLVLNNAEIRGVLNTLTTKSVLILGRFADPSRKEVLDGLRNKLREFNLLPIVFDFERPDDKDYTETVQTLAGLSLFVIVDVTSPKSTPLEMEATVKQFKIPFVPIIDISVDPRPYAMIVDSQNSFHWVLKTFGYESKEQLLDNIETIIINRALEKHNELRKQKANAQEILTLADLKK